LQGNRLLAVAALCEHHFLLLVYTSLWFAASDFGCLYDSHRNINPTTGMRMSLGRTNPTFPGEKLCAAII
jgi:hypothetical protein